MSDRQSPFAGTDVERLDGNFLSLLRYADTRRRNHDGQTAAGPGLTTRERRLFRFGLLAGLGEWEQAGKELACLADKELLTGAEVERTAAEAGLVMGWPACRHLGPILATRGIYGPANVAQAVVAVQQARETGNAGLSEREIFALGLGITWGARCWDT